MRVGKRVPVGSQQFYVTDLLLVAGLSGFVIFDVVIVGEWLSPTGITLVVLLIATASLLWRRTEPLMALVAVWLGLAILSVAFGGTRSLAGVVLVGVAVYSTVRYGIPIWTVLLISVPGALIRDLTDPLTAGLQDFLFSPTLILLALATGSVSKQIREGRRAVEEREQALHREREAIAEAVAAEERLRIAREIHDIVAHSLGVMTVQAGAAEEILDSDPSQAKSMVRSIRDNGRSAMEEMSAVLDLVQNPEQGNEPLPTLDDLPELLERVSVSGLRADLVRSGEMVGLPAGLQLSAFRVVQEALTNSLKHGHATTAQVTMGVDKDRRLEVLIVDNGNPDGKGPGAGRGLTGLAHRVALFHGEFETGPVPGGGWRVRAVFPGSP